MKLEVKYSGKFKKGLKLAAKTRSVLISPGGFAFNYFQTSLVA